MGYLEFYQLPSKDKKEILASVEYSTFLPSYAIEKDWWVVRTMDLLFQTEIKDHLVFKGGTCLSKAWGLIDRFSEDIDLALDRSFLEFDKEKPSRTEVGKLRKKSKSYLIDTLIPQIKANFESAGIEDVEIVAEETMESDQDPLNIIINYPNVTETSEYVLPQVKVEIGSRSLREPYTKRDIRSLIGEHYPDSSFSDGYITIPSVNPERTFLEKLFLLHEEFQRPAKKMRVKRLSRHLYDIHQIGNSEFAEKAICDKDLYKSIVEHRSIYSRLGGVDYKSHFPPNLNPFPPDNIINDWKKDYKTMQEEMIYGEEVEFADLIQSVRQITDKINGE